MTVDQARRGRHHSPTGAPTGAPTGSQAGTPTGAAAPGEGSATRQRILGIALSLMSQRGVDGTSMRDLAGAAGLNVASLYHYFPSKRDLLESVLVEEGILPFQAPSSEAGDPLPTSLAELLAQIIGSMFDVEDFVRLMVTEAMRGEATARAVGLDLIASFETSIAEWVAANRPDLDEGAAAGSVARLLSAMVVGIFIQHAAGVLDEQDLAALSRRRAGEAADVLRSPAG
ncbi:MAG TPA: TetR/AcrR family transcriptional regulator [Acidimicrobiales bacterium]|nr:TetR/AcrR family transcriptional regulator [Acidimicrobiales bacterium]